MYRAIQETGAEVTLEIGMAHGISTLFMCQAHFDRSYGYHIAIDPYEVSKWKSTGLNNVERAGFKKHLEFHGQSSHEVLPKLLEDNLKIDLALSDGGHLFDFSMVEFFYLDRLLKPGGLIFFDDLWMPSTRKVISYILRNRMYEVDATYSNQMHSIYSKVRQFLGNVINSPYDVKASHLPLSAHAFNTDTSNFGILKKVKDDTRNDDNWSDYVSF